jgi:deoxyadenosine/deoxycytidine kinase
MPEKTTKHIAIAGNIGSGKTTLTAMLAKHYKWKPHFEDVEHNPYLVDFYEDMPRWSFNLQIYFLNNRLKHLIDIHKGSETVIQDRPIFSPPTCLIWG